MAQDEQKNGVLFLILIGVIAFAGGFLALAVIVTIISALGLLTIL